MAILAAGSELEMNLPPLNWNETTILLTGGTGSFGRQFLQTILKRHTPPEIRVFSRDELKQSELAHRFRAHDNIGWFIGDVRDRDRLARAAEGVDLIVHAAAMKQVPTCEYNPFEAVRTNVHGAENVVNVALDAGVTRVIGLSTDKAVNPINLYGATKLCAEKVFIQGNTYAAASPVRLSCVRYGNVVASRGSIVPLFLAQRDSGVLTITDERMTRFLITIDQAVDFVISSAEQMVGGEIFIPRMPSVTITDLAKAIAPDARWEFIGIRPGEKLHETLLMSDEARHTIDKPDRFVVLPEFRAWMRGDPPSGEPLPDGFTYGSDSNSDFLDVSEIADLVEAGMKGLVEPRPDDIVIRAEEVAPQTAS